MQPWPQCHFHGFHFHFHISFSFSPFNNGSDVIFGRPWGSGWDVIFGRPTAWRHGTAQISLGFQLYRTGFYRIEVVFVARKENPPAVQAASCAGCELCGREPDLPAFSTDAHTLQCVCAISCFTLNFHKLIRLGQHISDDICYDI